MGEINNNGPLPKGWGVIKLTDVAGDQGIFCDGDWVESKDQDKDGQVRLIQLADVGDGEFRDKSDRHLTREKATELNCTFLTRGDVLIARMPEPLGRACIFPLQEELKYVTVVDVCILRVDERIISNKYIAYIINSPDSRDTIAGLESGSTRKRISRLNLGTIDFPLPPLPEQHRIVAKIEELFSELDKGVEALKTAQQQLKVYRQAVLDSAVIGTASKPLDEVILSLDQGWSPRCYNDPSSNHHEWGVIKTTAIQARSFLEKENKRLPEKLQPRTQHELEKGDLLITRAGPRARAGVCCLVKHVRPRLLNCDKVYRIRINSEIALPEYVEILLNSPKYSREIDKMKTGISDSGVNLTQSGLLKIAIPIPTLQQQRILVQEIESRLSVADKIEESIAQSLKQAEALRQSILKKAFSGKLVPQDPNDEPAEKLLARIRAERAAQTPENGTVKRRGGVRKASSSRTAAGKR